MKYRSTMSSTADGPPDDNGQFHYTPVDETSKRSNWTSKTANTKEKHVLSVEFEFKVTNSDLDSFAAPNIHWNILCFLERSYPNTTIANKSR